MNLKIFKMAVEKTRVITRFKALFPGVNLSKERLEQFATKLSTKPADDADDDAIDLVINDLNDVIDFASVAKSDDKIRTLEAKSKQELPAPPAPAAPPVDDTPAWAKVMFERLDKIESGKVIETKKQTAIQAFESSEVLKALNPELKNSWLNRVDVNSEVGFEEQIKALENEFTIISQASANSQEYARSAGEGKRPDNFNKEILDSIVESM